MTHPTHPIHESFTPPAHAFIIMPALIDTSELYHGSLSLDQLSRPLDGWDRDADLFGILSRFESTSLHKHSSVATGSLPQGPTVRNR